ncbi:MAG: lantibiotic dehydratase [Bacteroidota bacterium]
MHKFQPFNKVILRSPNFSLNLSASPDRKSILEFYRKPAVKEALLIASPALSATLDQFTAEKLTEVKKIDALFISLTKYMLRMTSRCTPFGLFASCSLLTTASATEIKPKPDTEIKKITRLDHGYLNRLMNYISAKNDLKNSLKYFPNTTLYLQGQNWRYVEFDYPGNKRIHKLSSFQNEDYFELIFSQLANGFHIDELVDLLDASFEISRDEALEFIDSLIDAQIIISELSMNVTGEDYLTRSIKVLEKYHESAYLPTLHFITGLLATINTSVVGGNVDVYDKIITELNTIPVDIEKDILFQTDSFKPLNPATIGNDIIRKAGQAVEFLSRFGDLNNKFNLQAFTSAFSARYEQREVPLVLALDPEAGIGYKRNILNGDVSPLLDGFVVSEPNISQLDINPLFNLLYQKLISALLNKQIEVEIKDADLKDFPVNLDKLSDTFAVMLNVLWHKKDEAGDKFQLLIKGVNMVGGKLIGRFCHLDKSIEDLCRDIVEKEEELNPNSIVAEFVHIPEGRTGNVLSRPCLRKFEIPYLANSAVPTTDQIMVDDLMLSVKNGRIILRSRKFNKIVTPKTTNAHNYTINSLPVYHFLNDIQFQDVMPLENLGWGVLQSLHKFLPRITYKDMVFSAARWNLAESDFKIALAAADEGLVAAFSEIFLLHQIPRYMWIEEGDNELLIDAQNLTTIKVLKNLIQKKKRVTLTEFLFDNDNAFLKETDKGYTNELVVPFFKTTANNAAIDKRVNEHPRRSFIPGDHWTYFKIYSGFKQADELLMNAIYPVICKYKDKKMITQWFFIRYADPEHHLRIRFYCDNLNDSAEIIQAFNQSLTTALQNDLVNKIQMDTYQRELERYGPNFIEQAELLFFYDSECLINVNAAIGANDELRWKIALANINSLLNDYRLNLHDKFNLMTNLSNGLKEEFKLNSRDLKLFSQKYRTNKPDINAIMAKTSQEDGIEALYSLFDKRSGLNAALIENEAENIPSDVIASLVHMSINRLFRSKQRMHEIIIYDFLSLYYKQEISKLKEV